MIYGRKEIIVVYFLVGLVVINLLWRNGKMFNLVRPNIAIEIIQFPGNTQLSTSKATIGQQEVTNEKEHSSNIISSKSKKLCITVS